MLPTMLPTAGQPLLGSAPVLAVKIDNTSSARPRVGLDSADIVYVEPVEAGLTRLMAIYASAKPAEVGPIRSARESDVAVLANYGRVAFAYSGASTITAATLAGGRQVNVSMDSGGGGFRRDSSRKAPYNVIGGPAALLSRAGGSAPAADIGFHVGPLAPEARPGSGVSTAYPLARLGFSWDVTRGRYLVRVDLRDGHVSSGRWSRSSAAAPTVLTTASGAEMTVAAGPLWVLLVPEGQSVSVS